ncbi:hypothetical protein AAFF_G00287290 [Aldrovandia affinis]|uniref:Uncharacterized protein n=1 Tax=Aldrovandia affinis TaxID=143900 RepID=A0AAD7WS63_9TELE|nr:hypothetical protein AAFF_G00287290 [Aldrovandia affinis]
MILKGLPESFKPFAIHVTQSDVTVPFPEFKTKLRSYEDNVMKARVQPSARPAMCVVENAEIPLDNAKGDNSQLEYLPQKVKKSKTGIRRFFSHVWKTLKYSTLCCCCCCCCLSVETD